MYHCPNCNSTIDFDDGLYCIINGNDALFCSEKCAKQYSRKHPLWRITVHPEELQIKRKREWRIA